MVAEQLTGPGYVTGQPLSYNLLIAFCIFAIVTAYMLQIIIDIPLMIIIATVKRTLLFLFLL